MAQKKSKHIKLGSWVSLSAIAILIVKDLYALFPLNRSPFAPPLACE